MGKGSESVKGSVGKAGKCSESVRVVWGKWGSVVRALRVVWGRREWVFKGGVCVSVLTAGLVYHKPPSCQYYDRSRWDSVSFAQSVLG